MAVALVMALMPVASVWAQLTPDFPLSEELRIRQALGRTFGSLDARIVKVLPSDQVVKYQRVDRRLLLTWDINAFAAVADKEIYFPIGFAWALEQVSHAVAAAATMQAGPCASMYLADMQGRIRDNLRRVMQNGKPRMIQGYFDFCNVTPACHKFFRTEKNIPPEHLSEFERASRAAFAFVYLHEMGHHMLGHSGKRPASMAQSQAMEYDADQWALEKGLAAGENVIEALPLFLLMETLSTACKGANCTHPSGADRYRRAISLARAYPAEKLGEPLRSNSLLFRAAIDRQESRFKSMGF